MTDEIFDFFEDYPELANELVSMNKDDSILFYRKYSNYRELDQDFVDDFIGLFGDLTPSEMYDYAAEYWDPIDVDDQEHSALEGDVLVGVYLGAVIIEFEDAEFCEDTAPDPRMAEWEDKYRFENL